MTQGARASRLQKPITHRVYVRRAKATEDGQLPIDGADISVPWVRDTRLRVERITIGCGTDFGSAVLSYIPDGPPEQAFEEILGEYTSDDQVRIVVDPMEDPLVAQPAPDEEGDGGRVMFEGVLGRHAHNVNGDARGGREMVGFVAMPMPWLDDHLEPHLVRGRWFVKDIDGTDTLVEVECPDLPPVANFRGRPSMASEDSVLTVQTGASEGNTLTAPVWSSGDAIDDRPATVRGMIASLLAAKLHGLADDPLPRHVTLQAGLVSELNSEERLDAVRYQGLDDQMPEVNIYGLGVFTALQKICDATGFAFCCWPLTDQEMADQADQGGDRRYQLRLWRKGTGDEAWLDLGKRQSTYEDDEAYTAANNTPRLNGMRDATEIVNVVYVAAASYACAQFPLRPLWPADQVDAAATAQVLATTGGDETKKKTAGTPAAKYVSGGVDFPAYGWIGRRWGLDCLGAARSGITGYTTPEDWVHEAEGFDFLAHLELDSDEGVASELLAARTDDVHWLKRVRHVLPLKHPKAKAQGVHWIIQMSDDSGATWYTVPVKATSLSRMFGITLDINNLATVSVASLIKGGTETDASKSLWQKILDGALRMRITCSTPMDHALIGSAPHRKESGSQYRRAQILKSEVEDVWVWPGLPEPLDTGEASVVAVESWSSSADSTSASIDQIVRHMAERRRDSLEYAAQSFSANTHVMDLDRYKLGQRITGVRGRNYLFNSGGGRGPNIVGITYHLGDGNAQGIELALEDQRFAGIKYSQRQQVGGTV